MRIQKLNNQNNINFKAYLVPKEILPAIEFIGENAVCSGPRLKDLVFDTSSLSQKNRLHKSILEKIGDNTLLLTSKEEKSLFDVQYGIKQKGLFNSLIRIIVKNATEMPKKVQKQILDTAKSLELNKKTQPEVRVCINRTISSKAFN